MSDDNTRTAFHEAGHSVVAAALGAKVYDVTIVPDGTNAGMTKHDDILLKSVDGAVAIVLAGGLSVWEHEWRRGEKLHATCWGDLEQFDAMMRLMCKSDGSHYDPEQREQFDEWKDGEALALQTLSDYWGAVEAVAAALLDHGTIRGELVHAIVAAHQRKAKQCQKTLK